MVLASLAIVSLLASIGVLLAVRATSDQQHLLVVRRSLRACTYEMRLFREDLPTMARLAGETLRLNLTALRLEMLPMLWLIFPMALLAITLQSVYGYTGLDVGQPALIKVQLKAATTARPRLQISPAGLRVDSPEVWIPSEREAAWRVVADHPGDYTATVEVNGESIVKRVTVSDWAAPRSPFRGSSLVDQLFHPSEPLLRSASVESIAVTYPEGSIDAFGHQFHWSVPFFGLSFIFTFGLRRRFGVTL